MNREAPPEELMMNAQGAYERFAGARERMLTAKNAEAASAYCHAHSELKAARDLLPRLRLRWDANDTPGWFAPP